MSAQTATPNPTTDDILFFDFGIRTGTQQRSTQEIDLFSNEKTPIKPVDALKELAGRANVSPTTFHRVQKILESDDEELKKRVRIPMFQPLLIIKNSRQE